MSEVTQRNLQKQTFEVGTDHTCVLPITDTFSTLLLFNVTVILVLVLRLSFKQPEGHYSALEQEGYSFEDSE